MRGEGEVGNAARLPTARIPAGSSSAVSRNMAALSKFLGFFSRHLWGVSH
jgi:hypothetical protein